MTEWRGIVQAPQIIPSNTGSYSHFVLRMSDGKQIEVDYTPATNLHPGMEIIARGEYNIPDNRLTASFIQIVPPAPVVFHTRLRRTIAIALAADVLFVIMMVTDVPWHWGLLFTFVSAVLLARSFRGNYPPKKVWVAGAISIVIALVLLLVGQEHLSSNLKHRRWYPHSFIFPTGREWPFETNPAARSGRS